MTKEENQILDKKEVLQKIRRIAFEIYENNYREKEIVIAGIPDTGYKMAKMLVKELKIISPFEIKLVKISVDKKDPARGGIKIDCDLATLNKLCMVLVDDVLHTGRTFMHSLKPFLDINMKKIETAVMIDRSFKMFPVSADYIGYELSTTLNDHIEVSFKPGKFGVFLY